MRDMWTEGDAKQVQDVEDMAAAGKDVSCCVCHHVIDDMIMVVRNRGAHCWDCFESAIPSNASAAVVWPHQVREATNVSQ